MARPPSSSTRTQLADAFYRQAEADFKDALTLEAHKGHTCTTLALIQSSAEKATKALILSRSITRDPFGLVKTLSHQPLQKDSRSQQFIRKSVGRRACDLLLALESMQPTRSTENPRYPWTREFRDVVETPALFFTVEYIKRFLPSVRKLLGAVRQQFRA